MDLFIFHLCLIANYIIWQRGTRLSLYKNPLIYRVSTFVCPTEILAFADRVSEFRALGAEVVGASVDSVYTHLAWLQTPRSLGGLGPELSDSKLAGHTFPYPLIADLNRHIARDYGVYIEELGHTAR